MKSKVLAALIVIVIVLSPAARASDIDLSGLSLSELTELQRRVALAMWETDEWQEVTVPPGVYEVGVDIPAGHWTLTCSKESLKVYGWASITYCNQLDETGKNPSGSRWHEQVKAEGSTAAVEAIETDIDAKEGFYIIIDFGSVVFTPYTPKALGFK